uniref:WG repeat-containing protein n=1 Tax=Marinifilum flexuosum TaxID=1117708 RepID=UPI00249152A6
ANYSKIGKFNEIENGLALVKSIVGTYGLIDKNGKEVVPANYSKIGKFNEIENGLALVKSIVGTYGFIDKKGNEIIEPIYSLKQIESKQYKIVEK